MSVATKNIAVFGSTGSIGTSALEVIAGSQGRLRAIALSAHARLDRLMEQACRFEPRWVVATDELAAQAFDWSALPAGTELLVGAERLRQVAADEDVNTVLAAIVGSAGRQHMGCAGGQEDRRPGE
jgi:1-deoxy-D-xylulose-5-phosphate reductoisomerase